MWDQGTLLDDQGGPACRKCGVLMELYQRTPEAPRDYWLMTELFVMLHGSDVCDKAKGPPPPPDPDPEALYDIGGFRSWRATLRGHTRKA